jgi:hypothetical protein
MDGLFVALTAKDAKLRGRSALRVVVSRQTDQMLHRMQRIARACQCHAAKENILRWRDSHSQMPKLH